MLLLLAINISFANPVTKGDAKNVAMSFYMANCNAKVNGSDVSNVYNHFLNGELAFYVFGFKNGGFVIVSADDEAEPIIGYSLENRAVSNIDNPVVLARFDEYALGISRAKTSKSGRYKEEWAKALKGNFEGSKMSSQLLQTTWNQNPYYNNLCPVLTYTGCVATAMSQIMKYHNWPTTGCGWHKYQHPDYGPLTAQFDTTTYNWDKMPNALSGSSTSTEVNAVATLCYHAGVAVEMQYSTTGSGAYSGDVLYALTNYFRYDSDSIEFFSYEAGKKIFYQNDSVTWYNAIKNEIDNNRPIFYAGQGDEGGHAWVCDGYDETTQKIHMNWGWGGSYNGFFAVPSSDEFPNSVRMITGIKPETSSPKLMWTRQASGYSTQSRGIRSIAAVSNKVAWSVSYYKNTSLREFARTTDGGKLWVEGLIGGTEFLNYSTSMITAASDSIAWSAMYGPSGGGVIVKTEDGGLTWNKQASAYFIAPDGFPNVVHFWNKNKGFAMGDPNGGYFELYTTDDGGSAWNRVVQANIPVNVSGEAGVIGYYDVHDSCVYFPTNKGRLYKSTDYGHTWSAVQTAFEEIFGVCVKNGAEGFIYGEIGDVKKFYRTTDGFATFTEFTPQGDVHYTDFAYMAGGDTLIAAGGGEPWGISYSTDDGNNFIDYAPFYRNYQFVELGVSPEGSVWAGDFNYNNYYGGMWYHGSIGLSADFNINKTSALVEDSTILLTNRSCGVPDSWEWNFGSGASPSALSGYGPYKIKYSTEGKKTITLTITKGEDMHVIVKKDVITIGTPQAVETEGIGSNQVVYPNPVSNIEFVSIRDFLRGTIQVYNVSGVLVWNSKGITDDCRIDISNMPSGVYVVNIHNEGGNTVSRKLVISR